MVREGSRLQYRVLLRKVLRRLSKRGRIRRGDLALLKKGCGSCRRMALPPDPGHPSAPRWSPRGAVHGVRMARNGMAPPFLGRLCRGDRAEWTQTVVRGRTDQIRRFSLTSSRNVPIYQQVFRAAIATHVRI